MLLSMHILEDELMEYIAESKILKNMERRLHNVRLLPKQKDFYDASYVYLIEESRFLTDGHNYIAFKQEYDVYFLFEKVQKVFEAYNSWERKFLEAKYNKNSLKEIIDIVAEILPNPIAVFDNSTVCLAWSGHMPEKKDKIWKTVTEKGYGYVEDMHPRMVKSGFQKDIETKKGAIILPYDENEFPDMLYANIFSTKEKKRIGNIGTTPINVPYTIGQQIMFDYLSVELASVIEDYKEDIHETRDQIILNLLKKKELNKTYVEQQLNGQMKNVLWNCLLLDVVYAQEDFKHYSKILVKKMKSVFSDQKNIIVEYGEKIVVISSDVDTEDKFEAWKEKLKKLIAENVRIKIGVSNPMDNCNDVYDYYAQALASVANIRATDEAISFSKFNDIFFKYILDKITSDIQITSICPKEFLVLYDYDKKHDSFYLETLEAFFDCNKILVNAAQKLFLHKNTLLYRMNKMKEIISPEFLDGMGSLEHFMLKLFVEWTKKV